MPRIGIRWREYKQVKQVDMAWDRVLPKLGMSSAASSDLKASIGRMVRDIEMGLPGRPGTGRPVQPPPQR